MKGTVNSLIREGRPVGSWVAQLTNDSSILPSVGILVSFSVKGEESREGRGATYFFASLFNSIMQVQYQIGFCLN
jgi:hypothetical protein